MIEYYTRNHDPHYYEDHPVGTNCGSYALNIKEWYDNELYENYADIEDWVDCLLYEGYELREVTSIDDCAQNEEIIAFRTYVDLDFYEDFDFHFKVLRNGEWSEKNGNGPVHTCTLENWGKYNSSTFFLAHTI